jgi:hypothetical protein
VSRRGQPLPSSSGGGHPRRRWCVAACLATTIAAGLASRAWPLPGLFAEYTGDALYAVAVFFGWAWLFPAARGTRLAAAAFLIAALVESAQSLRWPWLVELRATRLGSLVLGQGFQWADFVAYAVGAAVAFAGDITLRRGRRGSPPGPG